MAALARVRGAGLHDLLNELVPFFTGVASPARSLLLNDSLKTGIPTDLMERENQYEVVAEMPGVPRENVVLDVKGDMLRLGVKQQHESERKEEQEGVTWHRMERSSQYQSRAIRLPDNVDLTKIGAKYDNGVLRVTLPKKEVALPEEGTKHIQIE